MRISILVLLMLIVVSLLAGCYSMPQHQDNTSNTAYPEQTDVECDLDWIRSRPNILKTLVPDGERYEHVVRVADTKGERLRIQSDVENQRVICYLAVEE